MILFAFGTRPEWIKIKPIIEEINGKIPYELLFTGQHSSSFIDKSMEQYNVRLMDMSENHALNNRLDFITNSILCSADKIFENNPKYIVVQGDTTSAFALALAAFHRKIKIIHLEAGLRTFDKDNPYPEEFNRISIDAIADIHLCPTSQSKQNIHHIASHGSQQFIVGNTVLDNLAYTESRIDGDMVLITLHRRENLDIMDQWFNAINKVAANNPNTNFVFPMHPNPAIQKHRNILSSKNISIIDPLSHDECVDYLSKCSLVITDSGGLQEESSFLKKKCIVCREKTERTEGEYIFSQVCFSPYNLEFLFNNTKREIVDKECPYGDGRASQKILFILRSLI
jgi:UDP-N-acetylglucosamine 2-epimerase (non-hydrolysing)